MSSRSRMPFGKSGYFHRQEIDTSKPLPVGEQQHPMSSTNCTTSAPEKESADLDSFFPSNKEEMHDGDRHPANDNTAMDDNHTLTMGNNSPDKAEGMEEEEETTEQEDAAMADKDDDKNDNDLEETMENADMDDSPTATRDPKKQRYEQILQNAAQWVEDMEDVKWGLQVASIHNNILLDHMAMQGLDG